MSDQAALDLNELNEALAQYDDGEAGTHQVSELAVAARRYAAGTPLQWCETHDSKSNGSLGCDLWINEPSLPDDPCSIVERWITDPPEAVADARRTEEEGCPGLTFDAEHCLTCGHYGHYDKGECGAANCECEER